MATPTHSNPPTQPSSASKKATGHVTTPSNRGIASPAPRSVPSPAATRKDQSGKTPVNHPTASSHSGSKTLGGTPMVQNLSQTGMTVGSSPGAGHMSFGTPLHGLGVDLGSATPGQLNVPTPLLQSVGMAATMSEIMNGVGKRNEDEERRLKMRSVLNTIGQRKGRSCEESIARVARRVGLDVDLNADPKDKSTIGNRTIAMAGNAKVIVDVDLRHHAAVDVRVSLLGSDLSSEPQQDAAASKVLLQDLAVPDGILLNTHLDRFAANLSKLATLDKLSSSENGGVDCFEAITGVYTSLKKLYEMEKDAVKTLRKYSVSEGDRRAEREVLCKRSGKPSVHDNGKLGLSLAYWTTKSATDDQDDMAMDVDGQEDADAHSDAESRTWSLDIEVEKSSAGMYPSLRVSDSWLPEFFELPTPDSGEPIPWQEPPTTYASEIAGDKTDAMNVGTQRLPDLRFVAKLDPPLVLPLQTAMNVLNMVGAQPPQANMFPFYHFAVLNVPPLKQTAQNLIRSENKVLALRDLDETEVTHRYNLDVSQPQLSMKLDHLPFSHPRQLIELLPTLRQWASTGALLHGTFGNDPTVSSIDAATSGINGTHLNDADSPVADSAIDLDSLMGDAGNGSSISDLQIDMGFATSPNPTISIAYPDPDLGSVTNVVAQILPNADVVVSDVETEKDLHEIGDISTTEQSEYAKKLAKALEVAGDLSVWVEWMRK